MANKKLTIAFFDINGTNKFSVSGEEFMEICNNSGRKDVMKNSWNNINSLSNYFNSFFNDEIKRRVEFLSTGGIHVEIEQ